MQIPEHPLLSPGIEEVDAVTSLVALDRRHELEPLADETHEGAVVVGDLVSEVADYGVVAFVGHALLLPEGATEKALRLWRLAGHGGAGRPTSARSCARRSDT